MQVELYYLDQQSILKGQNFIIEDSSPTQGYTNDSINNFPVRLENATLSCYLPYMIAQDSTGSFLYFTWNQILGETNSSQYWSNTTIEGLEGSGNSDVVAVPATRSYLSSTAFVYRDSDGNLANYDLSTNGDLSSITWGDGECHSATTPDRT